jgi:hypothetical protein
MPIRARVIADNCVECRHELLRDCQESGLPTPTSEIFLVPEKWISHECDHMEGQFVLKIEALELERIEIEPEIDAESMRWKDEDEIEAPAWWNNLDATKNIGYPARETGRYGSHPSHDGFNDESEP